jgi:hypothetical protein
MTLPPKDDPRRSIVSAARLMRSLGVMLILLSLAYGWGFIAPQRWHAILELINLPAVAMLLLSLFLERGRLWTIAISLLMTGIACLFPLDMVVQIVSAMSRGHAPLAILFPMAFALLVLVGLGLLIAELLRARAAIRDSSDPRRGFEPVMNRPSGAIAPSTLPGDSHDPHSLR